LLWLRGLLHRPQRHRCPCVGSCTLLGAFGAGHFGGPRAAFARGFAGQRFTGTRGHFDRGIRSGRGFRFFGPDWDYGAYDYGCGYGYPYYSPYGCYPYAY
jgi:hypothetical protein